MNKELTDWFDLRSALVHSLITGENATLKGLNALPKLYEHLLEEIKNITEKYFNSTWHQDGDILQFHPGVVKGGIYRLKSGPFSSAIEILLFLMPLLIKVQRPSTVIIEGVTHSTFGRSTAFIKEGLLPVLEKRGIYISCKLERFGFYGTGQGRLVSRIYPEEPVKDNTDFDIDIDFEIKGAKIFISSLSTALAERQKAYIAEALFIDVQNISIFEIINAEGMGNSITIETTKGVFTCDIDAYNEAGDLVYDENDSFSKIDVMLNEVLESKEKNICSKDVAGESACYNDR